MKRTRWLAVAAVFGLMAAACTAGGGTDVATPSAVNTESHEPVTLTITGEWAGRECKQWQEVFVGFEEQYPWATVEPQCNINDDKAIAAINAGKAPDVVQSFGVDNVGKFCDTGAWEDLNPFIEGPDGLDINMFPPAALTYTTFDGKQCALPFETDAFGLYYNTDYFEQAGLTGPPKTTDELVDYAKKLTVFNADGSIKRAGFVPWSGYYCCGSNTLNFSQMFGASWLDDQGEAAFASDPAWAAIFEWQKEFIADVFGDGDFATGSERLHTFTAGHGGEWAGHQDFMTGRVAMALDGEWRTAFITDLASDLHYATAPVPTSPDNADAYGSGLVGGTILALPKGSPHPNEGWLLLKYLATDTDTLVYMTNNVNNVPTTMEALESPDLQLPDQFTTFLDVFQHPDSSYRPTSVLGEELGTYLDQFAEQWQSGEVSDLQAGLQEAQDQTNQAFAQAGV
jgi:multiple sugar transport system substrate-binding protein